VNIRPHVCQGTYCEEIARLRGLHWKYRAIARALQITVYLIQRSVGAHALLHCRAGVSSCLECRRLVDPKLPETGALHPDECCPWCGRRHDGDPRRVTTVLDRLAASEHPTPGARPMPDLRVWNLRARSNSAEVRARPSARGVRSR
jgi:hypothetical protein